MVVRGQAKEELLGRVDSVLQTLLAEGRPTGSLRGSLRAMQEAPVLILVFNGIPRTNPPREFEYAKFLVDTQSIGAAIQTMLLGAQSMGLGSLWICDVLFAVDEISSYVESSDELVAAVALGYPAEQPNPRPRRSLAKLTRFLE